MHRSARKRSQGDRSIVRHLLYIYISFFLSEIHYTSNSPRVVGYFRLNPPPLPHGRECISFNQRSTSWTLLIHPTVITKYSIEPSELVTTPTIRTYIPFHPNLLGPLPVDGIAETACCRSVATCSPGASPRYLLTTAAY